MRKVRHGFRRFGGSAGALALLGAASCGQPPGQDLQQQSIAAVTSLGTTTATGGSGAGGAGTGGTGGTGGSDGLAPLLPATQIPRFQSQLPRFFTYAPSITRNAQGQPTRKDYTVRIAKFNEQQLPPGFPTTPLFGYGGDVFVRYDQNGQAIPAIEPTGPVAFQRTSPGPKFEQTRLVPALIHYRNELAGQHLGPVDPTLDWANPNNFPKPSPPFLPFPPGYPQAQSPIVHTTHTHGIEVLPEFDGTPDTWYTPNASIVGPEYVSDDYTQPSSNQSAAFWYHDHSFGVTRLDVGFGLSGYSILRDPAGEPLDRQGNEDIMGFEDPNDWTSTVPSIKPGVGSSHTQGRLSVSLAAQGFVELDGRQFNLTAGLPSNITLDFFLPAQQANPFWFGAVQMYADCPSKGVNNAFLSQVELTGKPTGRFDTLTFPVPAATRSAIGNSCEDFDLRVTVNVPTNATGTYLLDNIRGVTITPTTVLPEGEFEVPIIVQDRSFRTDGSVFYPQAEDQPPGTLGANPDVNPYWMLLISGNTNLVNGKVWPNMNVKRHIYRFRMLDSAGQRFYIIKLSNGMPMRIIGTDGGYKNTVQTVTQFHIGVTERVDFLIDFSNIPVGTQIVMQNLSQQFPPVGPAADPNTDGTVMRFTVVDSPSVPPKAVPTDLGPQVPVLTADRPTRDLIQNVETDDQGRVLQAELDGQLFHELTTELPTVGATEDWQFINTTPLDHNKHIHLIQFQVISRTHFDDARYLADWRAANGNPPFDHPTLKLDPAPYFDAAPTGPTPEENGWKDTIFTPAHFVTRLRVRWAIQSPSPAQVPVGTNTFPINPVFGIGYIWHCHLLEHEDNEMMRPLTVIPIWQPGVAYPVGFRGSPGVNRGLVDYNAVDYSARVAHTSVASQPPPTRPDLWERINNQNGDWAVQIIYAVGDRVFFGGHVYRALVAHQATTSNGPPNPAFWELVL
jgi:FtsP/CotA-like multicopper oxidase with cupredoxin domain